MKEIIYNDYNLMEHDITEIVRRVKVLLVNSNGEILLGYSHNTYQFPGGHVEAGETLVETIKRELAEETGIIIGSQIPEPFARVLGFYKDWPEIGQNRKIEIYYYEIITDEKPNFDNTKYTENEKNGNFELRYILLEGVEEELKSNSEKYGDKKGIAREMLEIFKVYKQKNN